MAANEPRIESSPALLVAGLEGHFAPGATDQINEQWQRFSKHLGHIPGQVGRVAYGLCYMKPDGLDYLSGVGVSDPTNIPSELTTRTIPAGRYAVFSHEGHVSTLNQTMGKIWTEWLPASGLKALHPPPAGAPCCFERYGESFDPVAGTGDTEVWVLLEG